MTTLTEPRPMQAWADAERAAGRHIALVPTMGALHDGHLALVAEARRRAERVVMSVFVNPIQFDRRDDFEQYPRPLDDDLRTCAGAGVDAVYAPSAAAMYPEGFQSAVEVARLTEPLCGAARPGHFRGVTTVVTKLFHAVRPDVAVFGEKDYQQLAVIRRMTADLDFGIEIVASRRCASPTGWRSRAGTAASVRTTVRRRAACRAPSMPRRTSSARESVARRPSSRVPRR